MLRITTTREEKSVTLHLCGQLTGEYVGELQKALDVGETQKIAMDLSNVTFVDREAMMFLCGVKSRVSFENIPSYVTRWIQQELGCGSSSREPSQD